MKPRRPQPTAPKTPKTALVKIEKPIYGGAFLTRVEGKATFVPLTLPGEQASIRIVEDKRSYATAEPEAIVSPAPNRIVPRCHHFGACGGCSYQHATYEMQIEFKLQILRETLQRAGVQPPDQTDVLVGQPWGYRNRIRLAFDSAGRVGYRSRRSHEIIPIRECPIAAPLLERAALQASEILLKDRPAFRPIEISLFCDTDEHALLASIHVNEPATRGFGEFVSLWKAQVPELAGVECVQEGLANERSRQLARWGQSSILYRAAGSDYHVDHGAFFQVNRWLIDAFVEQIVGSHQGKVAWDLFAGVGLFARQLTSSFEEVIAIESAPAATPALKQNLDGTTAKALITDTLSFLKSQSRAATPDLIVVDPPRAGLGPEITARLGDIAAPALVYVSCDPSTLARDLKALLTSGYSLVSVTLADLFPQTFHLETVVTLRKS
ncbi:MAG TPA: 23S rRNA (uracil(1939)-C(5))-methyltransferase RlmD [Terracidiphilus sp.]|jgi:23S rRNA (uracil1939-C5)-methyltransferase|nr:23S rRNA (uracil(1939)-C(5))-methyltransferase RlmD [Terracidiphilus sp.]